MKTFKEHMSEETNPFALTNGFVGVEDERVRDNINALLNGITMKSFLTPYIALERVAKVLANYHIHLPKHTFEDIEADSVAFEVNQFGDKFGMTNDGEVVSKMSDPYFIYFEYNQNEQGTYDVFCEVVDEEDLKELSSGEEELDESVQLNELGDTEKGRERLEKYAAKAHSQTGYKSKLTPKEKKRSEYSDKALAIVDKKSGKKTIRSSSPLYDYDEEVKLNETSKERAKVYIKAAKKAKDDTSAEMGDNRERMRMPGYDSDRVEKQQKSLKRDYMNRSSGIERAKKILAKEEHLDELDQETYRNYHAAAGLSLKAKRQKLDRGTLTSKDLRQGQNRVKGLNRSAKKMNEEHLDEKLSPEQKMKIRRRLGPNTPENRQRQNSDSAREEIRLAKRGGKDKDLNEATEKRKELLKRYIKAAPHSVAALSAATRGFARDADAQRKDKKAMDARKSDERADKMFKKSWNRRQYIAKAVDKLTSEEKSVMPAWYEKEKSKSASLQAMTDAKKKEQKKKIDSAVRRLKEENGKTWMKVASKVGLLPKDKEDDSKIQIIDKKGFVNALKKGKQQQAKTPEKANFNVAKKLARDAKKTAMKKAMEKKSSK